MSWLGLNAKCSHESEIRVSRPNNQSWCTNCNQSYANCKSNLLKFCTQRFLPVDGFWAMGIYSCLYIVMKQDGLYIIIGILSQALSNMEVVVSTCRNTGIFCFIHCFKIIHLCIQSPDWGSFKDDHCGKNMFSQSCIQANIKWRNRSEPEFYFCSRLRARMLRFSRLASKNAVF